MCLRIYLPFIICSPVSLFPAYMFNTVVWFMCYYDLSWTKFWVVNIFICAYAGARPSKPSINIQITFFHLRFMLLWKPHWGKRVKLTSFCLSITSTRSCAQHLLEWRQINCWSPSGSERPSFPLCFTLVGFCPQSFTLTRLVFPPLLSEPLLPCESW